MVRRLRGNLSTVMWNTAVLENATSANKPYILKHIRIICDNAANRTDSMAIERISLAQLLKMFRICCKIKKYQSFLAPW